MVPTKYDVYAYQILHHFVLQHQYQVVTIKQQREDIWLMNAKQKDYPVILLSAKSDGATLRNLDYLRQAHQAILKLNQCEGKLIIINTSEMAKAMDTELFKQIVIHPNACSDDKIQLAFPELMESVKDVEDTQKEYVQITRSLEEKQLEMMKQQRKTMNFIKQIPKCTGVIAIICMVIWLLVTMAGFYIEDQTVAAVLCGAYYKMNVVSMHEYWRFLTSGFIHVDVFHLFMNVLALGNLGIACEKAFKRSHYISILLISIVVGNLFVYLLEGNSIGVGLSGGLFGLLGAFIVTLYGNGSIRHPLIRATILRLLMINLLISILPGVSYYAHLGGFLSGIFLGFIFDSSPRWVQLRKHITISYVILLGALTGLCLKVNVVEPVDKTLDRNLLQTVRNLGIDWYADSMQDAYSNFHTQEDLGL